MRRWLKDHPRANGLFSLVFFGGGGLWVIPASAPNLQAALTVSGGAISMIFGAFTGLGLLLLVVGDRLIARPERVTDERR